MDSALTEMDVHREEHAQKERDLQVQKNASDAAALHIPSMRYVAVLSSCTAIMLHGPDILL